MNMYVIMSCKFASITELNPVTGKPIETTRRGYGLIARELAYGDEENYRGCILYPDEEVDEMYDFWLKWARNLAFVGGLLGLVTFTCLIGSCCFLCEPWNFERWLLWCCLWASICMAFTNLLYGNWFCKDNVCKVSYGTGYAISAFMAYLMLANQVKSMAQPPKRSDMPPPGGREDDYWYDHEDERFVRDDEDDDDEEDDDEDAWQDETVDADNNRPPRRPWQRRRRRRPQPTTNNEEGTFVNQHDNYDEMQEYMSPEDKYAPPQDHDFLQRDKEHQERLAQEKAAQIPPPPQAQQAPAQPFPRYYAEPSVVGSQTPSQPGNHGGAGWNPAAGNPGQSAPAQAQFFDDESISTADTEHFQHMSSSSIADNSNTNNHKNSMAPAHDRIDEEEEEDTTRRDDDDEDDIVSRDPHDLGDARFA